MAERIFMPTADENWITISRDKLFIKLSPAEVDKAQHLIGIALSMESMEALPDHITNSPFVVRFFENNQLALERADLKGSITFGWGEGDDLLVALADGLKIAINERTLVKGARGTGFVAQNQEPFI